MEQSDFKAELAQALAVKLIEAQEAAELSSCLGSAGTPVSITFLDTQDVPSQGTPSVVSDSEDASVSSKSVSSKSVSRSQPRFLNFAQLSHIDWNRLANAQEWRTVLQLRGLPPKLCRREVLEALLEAHGLRADVEKVKTTIKLGSKYGSAVLHATSTEAVGRLCRFFHGRQFAGSRVPISVSFAEKANDLTATKRSAKWAEPKRINTEIFAEEGEDAFVAPPPGLEAWAAQSAYSWGLQLPAAPAYA